MAAIGRLGAERAARNPRVAVVTAAAVVGVAVVRGDRGGARRVATAIANSPTAATSPTPGPSCIRASFSRASGLLSLPAGHLAVTLSRRPCQTLPVAQSLPVLSVVTLLPELTFVTRKSEVTILVVPMFGNDSSVGLRLSKGKLCMGQ